MINKVFILLVAVSFVAFACKDDDPVPVPFAEQRTADSTAIEKYFDDNGITNVLYDCFTGTVIDEPCNGYVSYVMREESTLTDPLTPPHVNVNINVSYTGRLMDTGEQFDANDNIEFPLSNLILGWQVVLLSMQEGDSVTMYIPSGYAYGANETNGIPANSNLIFEMKLHQVN